MALPRFRWSLPLKGLSLLLLLSAVAAYGFSPADDGSASNQGTVAAPVAARATDSPAEEGIGITIEGADGDATAPPQAFPRFAGVQASALAHSFYFARAQYPSGGYGRGGGWATDWPTADRIIISVLDRLTAVDIGPREFSVRLDDPDLRRYPFLYAVEVGSMNLRPPEAEGLRNYLLSGGFLVVDDFWGTYQWDNFAYQMSLVIPEFEIVELSMDHPIFSVVYDVDEIVQVPSINNALYGGSTSEQGGTVPYCFGIFDDEGRLMVVINFNTDLGDAWEHAEDPRYPLDYSTYAYRMGANFIFYAMTR